MSRKRQSLGLAQPGNLDDPSRPVIVVAHNRPSAFHFPPHHHLRAQLVYASDGVIRVSTESATWIVPPQQAVWVPSNMVHSVVNETSVAFRTLYLHPSVIRDLPHTCCVVGMSPLLRELILYAAALSEKNLDDELQYSILSLILKLLKTLKAEPLQLPLPQNRRLRFITDKLIEDPSDSRSIQAWAELIGTSQRTLERLFKNNLGMNLGAWRQRLRLLSAISRLSKGTPVTTVSYDLGYSSPSAFVAMFRRELGHPPGRYLRNARGNRISKGDIAVTTYSDMA